MRELLAFAFGGHIIPVHRTTIDPTLHWVITIRRSTDLRMPACVCLVGGIVKDADESFGYKASLSSNRYDHHPRVVPGRQELYEQKIKEK